MSRSRIPNPEPSDKIVKAINKLRAGTATGWDALPAGQGMIDLIDKLWLWAAETDARLGALEKAVKNLQHGTIE